MRVTTAFACVRTIAETVGEVTLAVYERQKNGNAEKVDRPRARLDPRREAERRHERPRIPRGQGHQPRRARQRLRVIRPTGRPATSVALPGAVPARDVEAQARTAASSTVRDRGKWRLPAEKIWHLKGFGYDGLDRPVADRLRARGAGPVARGRGSATRASSPTA
jgi:hypothetical protein